MLFVCYPKCSTCMKAKKWLEEKGLEYELRDIRTDNPTAEELKEWHQKSGLPLKRFFNTSGNLYKERSVCPPCLGRYAREASHPCGRRKSTGRIQGKRMGRKTDLAL